MLRKKKGFTLVELLAVIVILAIILAIAVPSITNMVANSRKAAFESNVKLVIRGIEYKLLENPGSVTAAATDVKATLTNYGADPAQYDSFSITSIDPVTVSLVASATGKFAGWQTTGATYTNVPVTATP
jgi:prepilin-type N-terminal cleavage/methylation domain-containing protein